MNIRRNQKIKESEIAETVIVLLRKLIPKEAYNIKTIKRIFSEVIEYFENCSLEQKGGKYD